MLSLSLTPRDHRACVRHRRRGGGGLGADGGTRCENHRRNRAPRESQSLPLRIIIILSWPRANEESAARRTAPHRASVSPSPRVRVARPSCWPLVPVALSKQRRSKQASERTNERVGYDTTITRVYYWRMLLERHTGACTTISNDRRFERFSWPLLSSSSSSSLLLARAFRRSRH